MIQKRRTLAYASLLTMSALAIPLMSCGGIDTSGLQCGADVVAEVDAMVVAVDALATQTTAIQTKVLAACNNIASDLDANYTPPSSSLTLDQRIQTACTAASTAISAAATGATITYAYAAPVCHVDASAQLTCEASCDVDANCTEGTVDVRCSAGDLSVVCSGMCQAGAICEATAMAPSVMCNGRCDGVCTGTCSVNPNAAGECTGTCTGTCEGNCTVAPGSAGIQCGAYARCRGGCSVTGTAPQCEGTLNPPSCSVDAQCQAGCEGSGNFQASCEPATVAVVVSGGAQATALKSTLEANLGSLLELRDGLSDFVTNASTLASSATSVATSASASAACVLTQAGQLLTSAQNAVNVANSLQVTVTVSVMVTASAQAPAN